MLYAVPFTVVLAVRWGFVVHGGIDGYSRMVVFLRCATNNRSDTVLRAFLEPTEKYLVPSRVRTNRGGENIRVAEWMLTNMGPGRGSIIQGPSVRFAVI